MINLIFRVAFGSYFYRMMFKLLAFRKSAEAPVSIGAEYRVLAYLATKRFLDIFPGYPSATGHFHCLIANTIACDYYSNMVIGDACCRSLTATLPGFAG